jgi:hypothetical protein
LVPYLQKASTMCGFACWSHLHLHFWPLECWAYPQEQLCQLS